MNGLIERQTISQPFHTLFESYNVNVNIFIPPDFAGQTDTVTQRYRIPCHQRRYQWSKNQEKMFIHSLLNNYPIHSIICISRVDATTQTPFVYYDIEDGQSRLTCCWKFVNNLFTIKMETGDEVKYSDLTIPMKQRLSNYTLTFEVISFIGVTTRNEELQICSDIFTRINNGKPLSCNDMYHANSHKPCMMILQSMIDDPELGDTIKKYFGIVGKGKSRSLLSDLCGAILSIAHSDDHNLTTSFAENYNVLSEPINVTTREIVTQFFRQYLNILIMQIENPKKIYGKLSSLLGYYCFLHINRIEYLDQPHREALIWYIQKRNENPRYVPNTFSMLTDGEKRNCRAPFIRKRVDAIIKAFKENDTNGANVEDDEDEFSE